MLTKLPSRFRVPYFISSCHKLKLCIQNKWLRQLSYTGLGSRSCAKNYNGVFQKLQIICQCPWSGRNYKLYDKCICSQWHCIWYEIYFWYLNNGWNSSYEKLLMRDCGNDWIYILVSLSLASYLDYVLSIWGPYSLTFCGQKINAVTY